jgi:phage terminase large subunit
LYVEYDPGGIGIELDDLPAVFKRVPGTESGVIRGDSSRPETINHVARHGQMNIKPCEKWKGSVEDGIAFLKAFEKIVIHPRCEATVREAQHYSYKVDRLTKDVTSDIVDKDNHRFDAIRYALEPLIMSGTNLGVWARCAS